MAVITVEVSEWEKMEQRIKELEAEVKKQSYQYRHHMKAAKADGERLDWLEAQAPVLHFPDRHCTKTGTIGSYYKLHTRVGVKGQSTFRQAIDKARTPK